VCELSTYALITLRLPSGFRAWERRLVQQ